MQIRIITEILEALAVIGDHITEDYWVVHLSAKLLDSLRMLRILFRQMQINWKSNL